MSPGGSRQAHKGKKHRKWHRQRVTPVREIVKRLRQDPPRRGRPRGV